MENGWWVSTRREADAKLHMAAWTQRQERYSGRFVGGLALWLCVTVVLAVLVTLLALPGIVTVAGAVLAAVVVPRVVGAGSGQV